MFRKMNTGESDFPGVQVGEVKSIDYLVVDFSIISFIAS